MPICNPISGVSYVISPDTEKETLTLITFKMSFSLNQEEGFFSFWMNHNWKAVRDVSVNMGKRK